MRSITTYPNASVIRMRNRRITIMVENGITIHLQNIDESPEEPSCHHLVTHMGKVRHTVIRLTDEALDAIVEARIIHKNNFK